MTEGAHVRVRRQLSGFSLDIDFEASPGVTVLFGPSGSGKSLTLAIVAGALKPTSGRIRLGDRVLFDDKSSVDLPLERREIGWVFQEPRLFPHLTVEQNLRFGLRRARRRDRRFGFETVTSVLDIGALFGRWPRDLSGGEAQRVCVGRALLSQPRLLLLDEPLSALHDDRKAEIIGFLQHVRDTFAVPSLYVTHSMAETLALADRLVILSAGRVVAQGALHEVLQRSDLLGISRSPNIGVCVQGVVVGGGEGAMTRVRAGDADWICPTLDAPAHARVRFTVLARDVMIAGSFPNDLSAANRLPARVLAISPRGDGDAVVHLDVSGSKVLSLVSVDAVQTLGLKPGRPVWAVIRSVAYESGRGKPGEQAIKNT